MDRTPDKETVTNLIFPEERKTVEGFADSKTKHTSLLRTGLAAEYPLLSRLDCRLDTGAEAGPPIAFASRYPQSADSCPGHREVWTEDVTSESLGSNKSEYRSCNTGSPMGSDSWSDLPYVDCLLQKDV
ncbi:hypothetical protein PoB_004192500 [Plakobranchus ocellatus]|uniref:Uncharacterized protein n=1 Tax=Plakobranchus ocellatus TaxID=259542 RepID=A0AAV4B8J7_9GAST|nr:hypothetical protein PoB_004192500 [Plakobranchus ocellatus]